MSANKQSSSVGTTSRPVLWRTQPKAVSPASGGGLKRATTTPMMLKKPCQSQENLGRSSDFESPKSLVDYGQQQQMMKRLEIPQSPTRSYASCSSIPSPKQKQQQQLKNSKKKQLTVAVESLVAPPSIPSPPTPTLLKKVPSPQERKSKIAHYGRKQGTAKAVPEEPLLVKVPTKKRCGWITSQSDAVHIAYHDQEWGVPVHDDRLLFELLTLASAQSELSWSAILGKREKYRAAFAGFDPALVAKFTPANIAAIKSSIDILKQDGKVQSVVENAQRVLQIVDEFGSLDKYMWGFFNFQPIVTSFRMPSQVPVKTSRSEVISKDLIRRGFRGVAPAVVYSFMQAAGMTNDHLVSCFRHSECKHLAEEQQRQPQQHQQQQADDFAGQVYQVSTVF